MISCSFILAEFSMLLRERMKLIGWFLSHDLLCAWGILKSLNVFISMRRGRAWKKRARRTATASLPLWARIPRVYIWNNEFERAKDAICERPLILSIRTHTRTAWTRTTCIYTTESVRWRSALKSAKTVLFEFRYEFGIILKLIFCLLKSNKAFCITGWQVHFK